MPTTLAGCDSIQETRSDLGFRKITLIAPVATVGRVDYLDRGKGGHRGDRKLGQVRGTVVA
jgi:hypothetical protein